MDGQSRLVDHKGRIIIILAQDRFLSCARIQKEKRTVNGNIHGEHAVSAMLKEALLYAGYPECAILQGLMVSDKDGNRIYPDIVVADIRTGQPIAVFEIKATKQSEQNAFNDARREMAHFIDRCPCYVVTAINGGGFAIASVFSKDAEFPTWIPLSDMGQFKAMFGDYREATAHAHNVAQSYSKGIRAGVSNTAKTVFLCLTIFLPLAFGAIECFGVVLSTGFYNLTSLLIMCTAGAYGLSVHLKTSDTELLIHPLEVNVNN